ncbi:TetR/AcrR family transcriptional regulator [Sphingoaurantiacus capsulatus]|uniref:TetR/AcrR family transcriptional regulator n=1 Tax=Sphingoaurantiacus capsulatus TaxID=1771310 RepID=A0ABV7X986_9SPHN
MALAARKMPVQPRAQATVEAILAAAAGILEREGPTRLTTNAVAAQAGVSIGSLYQYFPNKQALTAALIERSSGSLETSVVQAGRDAKTMLFEAGLRLLVRTIVRHQLDRPGLERTLAYEGRRLPVDDGAARRVNVVIRSFLEQHRGRLWGSDINAAADDVQSMTRSLTDASVRRGDRNADLIELRVVRALRGYLCR